MEQQTFTLNGQPQPFSEGEHLSDLIAYLKLDQKAVVVEHNNAIIDAAQLAKIRLQPADKVEIIHFVGGG